MTYRTKTYIAGDWDKDKSVIEQLRLWNDSKKYSLSFTDAHDLTRARDSSLNCSIKKSLKLRLDISKTFVLVVGDKTKSLRAGSCQYCTSLNSYINYCVRGNSVDHRSYIEYECEVAKKDINKIVVIYNSFKVDRTKCPDVLKYIGTHIPAYCLRNGELYWNYSEINKAIE